jgi:signal transduction histidine kinase
VGIVRRIPWQLPVAAILLALLAALATLQHRWLGEVSEAERERMRAGLRTRASAFTQEFDTELTRVFLAFQVDADLLDRDPAAALGGAYERWQGATSAPAIVRGIYVLSGMSVESATLQRFDAVRRTLEPAEWPPEFRVLLNRTPRLLPQLAVLPRPLMMVDAVEADIPALVIPAPHLTTTRIGEQIAFHPRPGAEGRVLIVALDRESLRRDLVEPLVVKHFGEGAASEYFVTIVRRTDPSNIVYASGAPLEQADADVTTGVFDLRMSEVTHLTAAGGGRPAPRGDPTDRVAITIVRRANAPDGRRVLMAGGDDQGAWQVRLRHRDGSLESIVARSRRRNLAISLGVLGLLAASILLFLASAERQRRMARQQMEFVAAVSHELRTPLAVICSAGENLADGVVADLTQVKRYGALIETEGRRLGDMVERVMEFAGISAGTAMRARSGVDLSRVVAEAADALRHDAQDRGVTVTVHENGALPAVVGDVDALRSAVQNVIGNAVKYSPDGASVDVSTHCANGAARRVQIRVVDRGLGIDAADLPHIFKPFYRGRRAVDAQVRGTGVGLSVVRHVVDAHGGSIAVDSRAGEGTTVVVELPAADAEMHTA